MINKFVLSIALISMSTFSTVALSHHSISAEFDARNPVEVSGVLLEWKMLNPHTYMILEVVNDEGVAENWTISFGPASKLMRGSGWTADTLQVGEILTASGRRARQYNGLYMGHLERENGEVVFSSGIEE